MSKIGPRRAGRCRCRLIQTSSPASTLPNASTTRLVAVLWPEQAFARAPLELFDVIHLLRRHCLPCVDSWGRLQRSQLPDYSIITGILDKALWHVAKCDVLLTPSIRHRIEGGIHAIVDETLQVLFTPS